MSPELAARVLITPDLESTHARVLAVLALYAHHDGTHCEVGVATIQRHTGIPRRSIYRAMNELRAHGFYTDDTERRERQKIYSRTLHVSKLAELPPNGKTVPEPRHSFDESVPQPRHSFQQ